LDRDGARVRGHPPDLHGAGAAVSDRDPATPERDHAQPRGPTSGCALGVAPGARMSDAIALGSLLASITLRRRRRAR
jgi:hypothetical protein